MTNSHKLSIEQIKNLLNVENLDIGIDNSKDAYTWINSLLRNVRYNSLPKKDKHYVILYISKVLDLSVERTRHLASLWCKKGNIEYKKYKRSHIYRKYSIDDITLLLDTFNIHKVNGNAVKKILQDEYQIYGRKEYSNISNISGGYIYTLLKDKYRNLSKTKSIRSDIGIREPLRKDGKPGHLSIDTVHQKENNQFKEFYYINIVDFHTQWQLIYVVKQISEKYLLPVLQDMLQKFPFKIIEIHSDNGFEYINHKVSDILLRLHIKQLKSRPYKSEDNGQIETKNTIIRKEMGYFPMPEKYIQPLSIFFSKYYNDYLNYHHPCAYPTLTKDNKGRIRRKYIQSNYMTPYQKLKEIDPKGITLQKGISFKDMDKKELQYSHNEYIKIVEKEKNKILKNFFSLDRI